MFIFISRGEGVGSGVGGGGADAKQPISAARVSGLPGNGMCKLAVGYSKTIERFKLI